MHSFVPSVLLPVGRRPVPGPVSSPLRELLQAGPTWHNCPQNSHCRRRPEKCGGCNDSAQTRPTVEDQRRSETSPASNNYRADSLNHRLMKTWCASAPSVHRSVAWRDEPWFTWITLNLKSITISVWGCWTVTGAQSLKHCFWTSVTVITVLQHRRSHHRLHLWLNTQPMSRPHISTIHGPRRLLILAVWVSLEASQS